MKTESVCKTPIVAPRGLFRFGPRSIGFLLAVLVLATFPGSSALATPKCKDVVFSQYGYGGYIFVSMSTATPAPYIIFYTTNGDTPTHSGPTPTGSTEIFTTAEEVDYGTYVIFRALAYKAYPWGDSNITELEVCNYCP